MNQLGQLFKVISYGESHGPAVGCVIEGCPAGVTLDLNLLQEAVYRRRTAQTEFASARSEADRLQVLSGVFEGKTLGSPIHLQIQNEDARSTDYDALQTVYRPGHADYTYQQKYGFRDHRGGGRSSIRITAPLVAAGEMARQLITTWFPVQVQAYVEQIGTACIPSTAQIQIEARNQNSLACPHEETAILMQQQIEEAMSSEDTLGGTIVCVINHLPAGIGEPLFGKLSAQLAQAMMSLNTVKGIEFGDGFALASKKGSEANDAFASDAEGIRTLTNHSGGILGGISNGMPIAFRIALKPISSIRKKQQTVNQQGENISLQIAGRHDVCAVPRAIPIVEAYTNIVLADLILFSRLNKV